MKDFQLRNDTKLLFRDNPGNLDARGVILYGASISTSGRLGLGKEENYAYDIYEIEFIPEVLFGSTYRKSLTTLFPRFLKVMADYHEADIRKYFNDAFGYSGEIEQSTQNLIDLFSGFGINMYFEGEVSVERICQVSIDSVLKKNEISKIIMDSMSR